MSRHDLEDVEETPAPTTNIFLVETILRRLFKQIESVSMLKDLRGMCQIWDKLDTEELEERAFQGGIKSIDLTFSKKFTSLQMREFLHDTSSNQRLFRSFAITFPCSLAILNLYKFRWFYKDYSPTFLELVFPITFNLNQNKEFLLKELLRWAAPTLRGLVFRNIIDKESGQIPTRKSLAVPSFNFPHLREVNMKSYRSNGIMEAFKVIFIQENHPETSSLTSLRLRYIYPGTDNLQDLISNPSRWATLTMLEIKCDNSYTSQRFYQLANGLLSLAQVGMTLKKLDLGLELAKRIREEEGPRFLGSFRDLSEFFASQAGSLEALKLSFNLNLNVTIEEDQEGQIRIQIPVFERLHTLSLNLDTRLCIQEIPFWNILEFGSISQHFPALENLTILNFGDSIDAFLGPSYESEDRMNLKRIKISNRIDLANEENVLILSLDKCFGSVEAFICSQYTLIDLRILWDFMDTIRVLHIRDVNSELDLSQFKGLRRIVIEEYDKAKSIPDNRKLNVHEGRYLGYFQKVAELGLDSIMFRGLEMIEGQSYKEFTQAFPFRVEFEEKPVDWFDEDFMNI